MTGNHILPSTLDVEPESLKALEFRALLRLVAGYARTAPGAAAVLALEPMAGREAVEERLSRLQEAMRHLEREGAMIGGFLPDPAAALERLEASGSMLEAGELAEISRVAASAGEAGHRLGALSEERYPMLQRSGRSVPDLRDLVQPILENVLPDGSLADGASRELRRIRREIVRNGKKLREVLERFLGRPDVQDAFVTQRNGRFVLPVRADAPKRVKGIVHASSSSGATLFVEPLETVELNNEQVRLEERETEEQERILTGWSDRLRERAVEIRLAVDWIGRIDALQARVEYGRESDGVLPRVTEDGPFLLKDLCHPLLDRRLREEGGGCVPVSFSLDRPDQVLVLSGPNAGGKTVALKALGLAVLMTQAGIPVPAAEVVLPVYGQLRADIGDHQSIEADLSTFSAHLAAVGRFLRELSPPALLLFDEIGTGTEPSEGAALAEAVLEEFFRPGVTAVVTTHFGRLKAWAYSREGAVGAAMEFDEETLRPTFRVIMNAAGVSAGLEIAERLGLSREIVEKARGLLGSGARETEAFLARLREMTAAMEDDQAALRRDREALAREREAARRAAEEQASRLKGRSDRAIESALKDFRRQAGKEIQAIRDRKRREKELRRLGKTERAMKGSAERRRSALAPELAGEDPLAGSGPLKPERLRPGAEVLVRSLARRGTVEKVRGEKVQVRMGTVSFTVQVSDLAAPGDRPEQRPGKAARGSALQEEAERRRRQAVRLPGGMAAPEELPSGPAVELLLLGKTVEQALEAVDRFLDRNFLAGSREVRIVHGHGTGRLKTAVRKALSRHPQVESHRPGRTGEGGDGATVVSIRS